MPPSQTFTPVYDQPVTLATLNQLEPSVLSTEITRLRNSIGHLQRSNEELKQFTNSDDTTSSILNENVNLADEGDVENDDDEDNDDDDDKDDLATKRECLLAIKENQMTISAQEERIKMIRIAIENQLGVDAANAHYDFTPFSSSSLSTTSTTTTMPTIPVHPGFPTNIPTNNGIGTISEPSDFVMDIPHSSRANPNDAEEAEEGVYL